MNYSIKLFTGNYLHFFELFQLFPNIYFYKIKIESKLRRKHPRLAQEDDVLLTEFLKIYDPSFRDFCFLTRAKIVHEMKFVLAVQYIIIYKNIGIS